MLSVVVCTWAVCPGVHATRLFRVRSLLPCLQVGHSVLGAGPSCSHGFYVHSVLPCLQVGHNALGAGQVVDQGAKCVDHALASGGLFEQRWVVFHFKRGTGGERRASFVWHALAAESKSVVDQGAKCVRSTLASGGSALQFASHRSDIAHELNTVWHVNARVVGTCSSF